MEKKKKLALFLACSASILQLVSAMQPLASVAYAAETAGSSTLTTGTEPTAVDQTAAVAYIGLIADAAQKATENNPIDASLLIGYSILYTDWGTTLGGQAGNYLPAVGQSGTQQTLADDFRIFADTFYSASKDSLDAAPDRETQSALLESYVKVPGIAQQLAALIAQYNLQTYDLTAAATEAAIAETKPAAAVPTLALSSTVVEPASVPVNYTATIYKVGYSIDTLPWGVPGYQLVATSSDYIGSVVQVTKESLDHAYGYIVSNGTGLGWVDLKALKTAERKAVAYSAYITSGGYEIDSLPWGEPGYALIGYTSAHLGKQVDITFESADGNYKYASSNGKAIGWVDKRAFGLTGTEKVSFLQGPYSIDTLPWGTPGYAYVGAAGDYAGIEVTVKGTTQNGLYALVSKDGKDLGWIDNRAITNMKATPVNYSAYITSGGYEIDSLPWGTPGFTLVGYTSGQLGKQVDVLYESLDGNYKYVSSGGKSIGWVDKRAFGLTGTEKTSFLQGTYSIDTLPWGTPGYAYVGAAGDYAGIEVTVKGTTQNGLYALISKDGKDLGWIDNRAVKDLKVKQVSYSDYITSGGYEIDSLPWGEPGFALIGYTSSQLGKKVDILYESLDGNYKYVNANGKNVGWIDKRAFGLSGTEYSAMIQSGSYSIDTLPWGTPGFAYVGASGDYVGAELTVKGTTKNGLYALLFKNGQELGWVDNRAIKPLNVQAVAYSAYISGGQFEIDTLPWGEYGFKAIGSTASLVGVKADISKKTADGNYLYASLNGQALGWIDKRAFGFDAPAYSWYITDGSYSITNLPTGTQGSAYLAAASAYAGKELEVIGQTQDGAQRWVAVNGQPIGWVDARAGRILYSTTTSYTATIGYGGYSIDSLPWGTQGFYSVASSSNYVGQTATVSKISVDGSYVFITIGGKALGWIDKRAFEVHHVVYLDPGHGGTESGATYSGVLEKTLNLEVSNEVKTYLEALGYTVIMTRTTDQTVSLLSRSIAANASAAEIFVSIHHNAMPTNTTVTGVETYYYEYDPNYPSLINAAMHNDPTRILESAQLAAAIHESVVGSTGAVDRGIRSETFSVLRETDIPAVLLELGYMSSPTELQKLTSDSYQTILAKAITSGIVSYFK
jgi:N-acetylmuramoyl-L-alanine amidase